MKKALISPNEVSHNPWTGDVIGVRIAEICDITFEVAEPLFWVDCADDVVANEWYFLDGQIVKHVQPEPEPTVIPETEPVPTPSE